MIPAAPKCITFCRRRRRCQRECKRRRCCFFPQVRKKTAAEAAEEEELAKEAEKLASQGDGGEEDEFLRDFVANRRWLDPHASKETPRCDASNTNTSMYWYLRERDSHPALWML